VASYSGTIDLRVTGNALKEVDLITKRINDLRSLTKSLKPVPNLFDKRGSERIAKEKEELRKLVEQYGKGTGSGNRFSNTIAGLNSQLNGFNRIVSNTNIKSDEFVQSLTASEKVSRRLSRAEAERLSVLNKINTANTVGRAGSVKETLDLGKIIPKSVAGLEFYQQQLQDTLRTVNIGSSDYRELAAAIASVNQQLSVAQGSGRIQGPALPPGFNERGRIPSGGGRRGNRGQDILTGAGFPLLFGGGPVQALAGGIGGAVGGLGGSIAASAISAQVEQVVKASAELGQALNPLTLDLERVAEASGFAGTETQQFLQKIEKYAEATEAARLATALLETKVGKGGVKALKDFGESAVTLGNNLSVIFTQVLAAIAKAAGPLLDSLAKFAGEQADVGSFLARGPGTSQEKLAQEILKTNFTSTQGELTTPSSKALQEFSKRSVGLGGQGFKTAAEAKTFATGVASSSQRRVEQPVLQEIETLAGTLGPEEKTKKGRESRLPQLQAEVALQERLAVLSRQVVKAKEEENPVREAALNMEIALEKQATAIEKINLKKIPAAEKAEEIKKVELATDKQIFGIQDKLDASKAAQAKKAAETLKGLQGEQDLLQARLDGRLEEEQLEQRVNKILEANKDLTREQVEQSLQGTAALKEQVKALEKLESMYKAIGQSISSGIVDALSAAVEGTKSLADIASQTLRQVANILLQFGVNTALGGIPGFGDFFKAKGGPVSGGSTYMVGEKGPELFVPNTSGTIVPNNKLGGGGGATNVVVNVDAKGSSASGDSGAGKQLGGLIGAAVQAELIKQQRPGGLLSR